MWILNNSTDFQAEHSFQSNKEGKDTYIVAIKATFDIAEDGSTNLAQEQVPMFLAPFHYNDDPSASLLADTDLDYCKPGTDVIVSGSAWSESKRPVTVVDAGIQVGPIRKILRVHGDRVWQMGATGMRLTTPKPFLSMPIRWEKSFGGKDSSGSAKPDWDERNPIGTGFSNSAESLAGTTAPNCELASQPQQRWSDRPSPASFSAVARHWLPRRTKAGTYDQAWQDKRAPLWPEDLDERFFMCAPEDQQVFPYLKGGELVTIVGMNPDGRIDFKLPRKRIVITVRFEDDEHDLRPNLATVLLLPDVRRVCITWHAALDCHGKREQLADTEIWEKQFVSK